MSWLAVTFTTQEINSLIRAQRELTDVWRRLVKELESLVFLRNVGFSSGATVGWCLPAGRYRQASPTTARTH